MSQKGFVNILVIVGAMILVGVAGYFALVGKTPSSDKQAPMPTSIKAPLAPPQDHKPNKQLTQFEQSLNIKDREIYDKFSEEEKKIFERNSRRIGAVYSFRLALKLFKDAKKYYPNSLKELNPTFMPYHPTLDDPQYSYQKRFDSYILKANLEALKPILAKTDLPLSPNNDLNPDPYILELGPL